MMSRCTSCKTSWTSLGMTMCPICGTKVDEPAKAIDAAARSTPEPNSAVGRKNEALADPSSTSTAVLEAPPHGLKQDGGVADDIGTVILRAADHQEAVGPKHPKEPPAAIKAGTPCPVPVTEPAGQAADPQPEKRDFNVDTIMLKSVPPIDPPHEDAEASKATRRREAGGCPAGSLPDATVGRSERRILPLRNDVEHRRSSETAVPHRRRSEIKTPRPNLVDRSALLNPYPAIRREDDLPAPARPLNGPMILGALGLVTGILLPLTAAFENNRVFGVIGFCLSGFFLPFSPIAWIVGLGAEQRRREQRLRPERRVVIGRLLGQWGTLLLITEGTIGLILVAALRLGGKLPATFWAS